MPYKNDAIFKNSLFLNKTWMMAKDSIVFKK